MSTAIASAPPKVGARVARLAAFALALFAVADLNILEIHWQGRSISPWHRALALGVAWGIAATIGLVLIGRRRRRLPSRLFPLTLFVGWMLVSSVSGIHPARSVFVWLGYAAAALAAIGAVMLGRKAAIVGLAAGSTAIAWTSLIAYAAGWIPDFEDSSRLAGLTLEPNILATIAGLSVVTIMILAADRRSTLLLGAVLCAPSLLAVWISDTRTILAALLVVALIFAWGSAPRATLSAALCAAVLVVAFTNLDDLSEPARRSDDEQLSELNGRTRIWGASIDWIGQDPFMGAGLASGPTQFFELGRHDGLVVGSQSSHDFAIEIAREAGVIGLGLALWAVAAARPWRVRWLRPLLAYLLVAAATMPTSGLPGLAVAAWFVVIAVGAASSPGVHSTALRAGRQESVGSSRGTDGLRLPLHQP